MVEKDAYLKIISNTSPQKEFIRISYTTGCECRSINDLQYSIELEWYPGTEIMDNDCKQPLRMRRIRALNGCAGSLFGKNANEVEERESKF